jgi:hypothetical protein
MLVCAETNERLMSEDPEMMAYLDSLRLEATARYVRRGRLLAELGDEELRQRWVRLFKLWLADYPEHDHREREDVESELQLRGLLPPFDRVPDDLAVMCEKSGAHIDALLRDPDRAEHMEQRLNARLEAFRRNI